MLLELLEEQRLNKWTLAQTLEEDYQQKLEKYWNIVHDIKFWNDILRCDCTELKGIEIGCGNSGVSILVPNIIGIDPLPIKGAVRGLAEYIPFNRVQTLICHNVLDHTIDPERSFKEIVRVADDLIFSSNVFKPIVSYVLNIFDKIHPYHFTKKDINRLFQPYDLTIIDVHEHSVLRSLPDTDNFKTKLKVLLGAVLGTKFMLWKIKVTKNEE